jgi:hypothetical protein
MLKQLCTAVVALAFLVGCGSQKGDTVMSIGKGDNPGPTSEVKSGREGRYAIYPNTSLTPIRVETLEEGDDYGFRKRDDGKLIGVLGDVEVPLEATMSSGYYIKYQGR